MNQRLSRGARAACALLFTGATACAASDGPSDPGPAGESADALSVTSPSFVTLRADLRRCMGPMCGGYFVRDVNVHGAERYVSGLDFTESGLPADTVDDVRSAPANELVIRGRLGPPEPRFRTRELIVLEAFRGMPDVTQSEDDAFYQVHARKPPIACLVAPCPNEIASWLNTTREEEFDRVFVSRAASPWVDEGWLASRVTTHNAVVAGVFAQGEHFPGGFEEVLEVSQVFVRLPDRIGPCPRPPTLRCPEGTIAVQQRTDDRCLVQVACVTPGVCPQYVPACPSGYTRTSWAAPPGGCPAFACDPSFVVH
jgi:hypothetical protein